MNTEVVSIIILSALVLTLGILLLIRLRNEKRQPDSIRRMNLVEFADFLRTNSLEGNIQAVAGKVSSLLTTVFGCERIVFLRKKRGQLELNYYHGIRNFQRDEFRVPFRNEMGEAFSSDFLPRPIEKLESVLPDNLIARFKKHHIQIYFPVYWRDNLYGVYFVSRNSETLSPAFTLLVASLAHSLAAAYHIKWHESRYANLEQKLENSTQTPRRPRQTIKDSERIDSEFLPLVKMRDSKEIVPRIMEPLRRNLGFEQIALAYRSKGNTNIRLQLQKGLKGNIKSLQAPSIGKLIESLKRTGPQPLQSLDHSDQTLSSWFAKLQSLGFTHVADFSLNSKREGLLVWSGGQNPETLKAKLEMCRTYTADLIENAEAYELAEELSYTDALTGLANQRYMYKRLEEEISRARRYERQLAFILFDLDELKQINDTHGHLAGDTVLKQVGQSLRKSIRTIDVVARYGGDEFCVIMPEADEGTCVRFMIRMAEAIAKTRIRLENLPDPVYCTVSLGGALFPLHAQDAQKLIHAADMALLSAKETGRNRYVVYSPQEFGSSR